MIFTRLYEALTRFAENFLKPIIGGAIAAGLEWTLGGVQYIIVKICDLAGIAIAYVLGLVPFPNLTLTLGDASQEALDLVAITGLGPAVTTFFAFGLLIVVLRLIPGISIGGRS